MERGWRPAARWGGFVARRRWIFLGLWVAAVVTLGALATTTSQHLSPSGFETDTPASNTADVVAREFPQRRSPVVLVTFTSASEPITDPAYEQQVAAWRADLQRLISQRHADLHLQTVPGKDGRTVALTIVSNQNAAGFVTLSKQVEALRHPGPATVEVGGFGPVYYDFVTDSEQGVESSERLSLTIALVLLLLVFGGVVAGLLPVLTGLATVSVAVGLIGLVARVHEVSIFSLNVSTILGIGLGIDYSLLVVNRFREELRAGAEVD
ncbi:MAG: MMPL family transporter, partial [Candidatus Dormiibacterota bacterium]